MEIRLESEEFAEVRKRRREIEERFSDLDGLERTLRSLKLRFLIEQKETLEKRLAELEKSYAELVEFERKAAEDKEFLMEFRRRLSEENRELMKKLEAGR